MILDAAAGRMPAYIDTGLNVVHVDDVAEGHVLALERGRIGERYILGGENMILRDLLALIAEWRAGGRRSSGCREALVWPVALAMERLARLDRDRAAGDARPSADGAQEDVLFVGEGDAGARLSRPPGARRRSRTRWHGFAPTECCAA